MIVKPEISTRPSVSQANETVQVLCAADENYAMSLCVTLTTAVRNLRAGRGLRVFLIDGGISEASMMRLRESLAEWLESGTVDLQVITADPGRLDDLSVSHHISHTAYFRLLAAEWLPPHIDKAIYLDSDLVICDDLTELWELDSHDHYCWAVPDVACPHFDARTAENFRKAGPYLATLSPVRNYQDLGLPGDSPYFNSGLMVLYLDRWRRDGLADKFLKCLRDNEKYIWCWDQYALNVVLAGRWGQLPLRWNQGAHAFEFPDADSAPIAREQFPEMLNRPAVVHFTTEWKPWDKVTGKTSGHPAAGLFFEKLDQTAWAGWRPARARFSLRRKWDQFALAFIKTWVRNWRKLNVGLRS